MYFSVSYFNFTFDSKPPVRTFNAPVEPHFVENLVTHQAATTLESVLASALIKDTNFLNNFKLFLFLMSVMIACFPEEDISLIRKPP